ncbi:MAG: methyltransferase domain-containing protein [Planctomycetes bacterium]|nr:methyltransferase domain-containing protein [Planctomycetota bacterium]
MPRSGYDDIAEEYYDLRHVTCRNFDNTTKSSLVSNSFPIPDGKLLEIGAGRGRAGEFLGVDHSRVVQLDNSQAMFDLAVREECSLKILADACAIPLASGQFKYVVGFLIDPFMGLDCLAEAHRMLVPEGRILLTVPTHQWGTVLRTMLGIEEMTTRFKVLDTENIVVLPSVLHTPERIDEMLKMVGFQKIEISCDALTDFEQPVSSDITSVCETLEIQVSDLPIIHTIRATR